MDDDKIVELFWQRAESAIRETEKKYARYIKYISKPSCCCTVESSRPSQTASSFL